ncbi:DUF6193 family natural product biosynthesis protein [Streptomyces prunicolor]|uniref:DUF6193 family natural product biosynthesis protein n=1 Tax=Streptomyces prunicolor TaxID=67348 RepID=UPI0003731F4E|nr:DUF6193 family natural product biosynthesis protein [Streptomyces prunicolor]
MDGYAAAEAVVEARWQAVRDDGGEQVELLEAAYGEPRLRSWFPWISMGELHFSRCTESPWTWDVPYVHPAIGGPYLVAGPLRNQVVGPAATADEAIALVVQHLPADWGPAFFGDREALAAHEAETRRDRASEGQDST